MKNKYKVEVSWKVANVVEIEANTPEEAEEIALWSWPTFQKSEPVYRTVNAEVRKN